MDDRYGNNKVVRNLFQKATSQAYEIKYTVDVSGLTDQITY